MTGATGFIGRNLTAHLVARGDAVRAVVRAESRRSAPPGTDLVRAPLEIAPLQEAFAGVDAVVHLAAVISALDEEAYRAVNVDGTRAVAVAARAAGARLIHVSSLAAAGPAPATEPRSEDDPPRPLTPYGRSKLEGERVVGAVPGLRWTILRPGVVYGPGDRAMLPLFRIATFGLLPLVGRRDAAYTLIHVGDAVRAIDAALGRTLDGETIFVGHAQPATAREVLDAIRTAVGRRAVSVPIPSAVTRVATIVCDVVGGAVGRPLLLNRWRYSELTAEGFVCRVDRLRDRLGVVAELDLGRGLADTADWYRRQGWL